MTPTIQCLGWWVWRNADPAPLGAFYRDTLGLPKLHDPPSWAPPMAILWGGRSIAFEVLPGGRSGTPAQWVTDQPVVPILRCTNLGSVLDRLARAGTTPLDETVDAFSRTVYYADPAGNINGLRQRDADSPFAEDWLAFERDSEILHGVDPLPADIADLGWIRIHAADVPRVATFYRDVLGLYEVRKNAFDLGDAEILEIAPGGQPEPIPAERAEASSAWVLRVTDVDAVVARLKAANAHVVNNLFEVTGHRIAYVVDPEGHLLGVQSDPEIVDLPEDIEAARRWRSRSTETAG